METVGGDGWWGSLRETKHKQTKAGDVCSFHEECTVLLPSNSTKGGCICMSGG